MARFGDTIREGVRCLKYIGAGLVGFAVDAILLHVLVGGGMEAAWARVISLLAAMHVTFVINGLLVFRTLERAHLPRQWASYMLTNGVGNFWNSWLFVTLVSTHWPFLSNHLCALSLAASTAWLINYASTRFLVFRRAASRWTTLVGGSRPGGAPISRTNGP
jgi:putative flippase GtrA